MFIIQFSTVILAAESIITQILYNDIHCLYTRCYGSGTYTRFRTPSAPLIYVSTGLKKYIYIYRKMVPVVPTIVGSLLLTNEQFLAIQTHKDDLARCALLKTNLHFYGLKHYTK